jgi:hypothetical protein
MPQFSMILLEVASVYACPFTDRVELTIAPCIPRQGKQHQTQVQI